jgi:hypothetical protein
VAIQSPGEFVEYGPESSQDCWTELYLVYPKNWCPAYEMRASPGVLSLLEDSRLLGAAPQNHGANPTGLGKTRRIMNGLAAHGLSRSALKRRWASVVGVPPSRYAARLLAQPLEPISSIAHQCGFEDEFYLSKAFCRIHGIPPCKYRKAIHKHQSPAGT